MSARVALVIPWFGAHHTGGAEQHAWQIATRLVTRGHEVEVLATCCAGFHEDWASNGLRVGRSVEAGVQVRRFAVAPRDRFAFDTANRRLLSLPRELLRPGVPPVDAGTAQVFVRENIHSPDLIRHLVRKASRYDAILFLPYLYGTTLLGLPEVAERAWLLPCLHDEAYAYLPEVAALFRAARGILFISEGEAALAARLYGPGIWAKGVVAGGGVEAAAARSFHSAPLPAEVGKPFLLYLGRRDTTKNTDLLVEAFRRFRAAHPTSALRLILAGPGPRSTVSEGGIDLGLVDEDLKAQLLNECVALVQPSLNESFSRTIMEAWHQGRPVVVHRRCLATERSVEACGGGLTADEPDEWAAIFACLADLETAADFDAMGERGRRYAVRVADWGRVIERYEAALELRRASSSFPPSPSSSFSSSSRSGKGWAPRAIHQLLPTLSCGDAIGNYARFLRDWLRAEGYRSELFCRYLDPRLNGVGMPFRPSHLRPDDGVIYHHSIGSELTPHAVAHPGPKLLIYHNITPSHFFAPYRPEFATLLSQGYSELRHLAKSFEYSVGDSAFNAAALSSAGFADPGVLPIAVDPGVWSEAPDPDWMQWLQDGSANLLFVGRLAPNKRQEDLIAAFAHVRSAVPSARLILVGMETPEDTYSRCLRVLAEELGVASRLVITGEVNQAQLHACFRTAHLYWSMSEHEGFGVPLVEAMWFDIPILAYRSTAVPETLGRGGLLFNEKRFPELAILAERLLFDDLLREKVLRAQRERRPLFLPEILRPRIEGELERFLCCAAPAPAPRSDC